jgi:hypothetical protein
MVVVMMVVEIISSLHDRMESKINMFVIRERERERERVFVISEVIV